MVTAIVLIWAEANHIVELGEHLAGLDGVAEVYSVAGDEDLVAILRVAKPELVATLVTEKIAPLAGVTHTRTLLAFRAYGEADFGS
jgi:DNA-binding Lrp family transcriptional regulator